MAQETLNAVLRQLRKLCAAEADRDLHDSELLERFTRGKEESAFTLLVQRHGPMVLGVCERILPDRHAAEDAFQATFLVLVRRAAMVRKNCLASWLYGVARRVALHARAHAGQQRGRNRQVREVSARDTLDEVTWQELRSVLDEEIGALPERLRAPIVLCYLQGKSYSQAARELGWPKSSLERRLSRARQVLRVRFSNRGITLPATALAAVLTERVAAAALPNLLILNTVKAASLFAAGNTVAGILSSQALALAEESMKGMLVTIQDAGGQPVSGTWVCGLGPLLSTPAHCEAAACTVYDLQPGKPRLMVFYQPKRRLGATVALRAEDQQPTVVKLGPTATFKGRVIGADGKAVSGITVDFFYSEIDVVNINAYRPSPVQTDAAGAFTMPDVIPNLRFDVFASRGSNVIKPGRGRRRQPAQQGLQLKPGESRDLGDIKLRLAPDGTED